MRYLSLFSGIGGFEYSIQNACPQAKCIGYSEIDKYASAIYKYHYPKHKELGDARNIISNELPDFDLLAGGFPCQTFSIAGKRAGFDDTRGTLFFEIARILRDKRPRCFLLENVQGLLSHDAGKTFQAILKVLSDIGYRVQWQILNSKFFGVPQNRPRVFIVGHLRRECKCQVFPIGKSNKGLNEPHKKAQTKRERIRSNIASALAARDYKGGGNIICFGSTQKNCGIFKNQLTALTEAMGKGGGQIPMIGTLRTHKDGRGFRKVKDDNCPAIPARAREDGSGQPVIFNDMQLRRLTPVECERLQGFDDDWTKYGFSKNGEKIIISDTQRYKCLGNAVTTNVVRVIIEQLFLSPAE